MSAEHDHVRPAHDCALGLRLRELLETDDVDAAIDAGLMRYVPCAACDAACATVLVDMQRHLASAWAARDRYLARQARLARRAAEREAKRASSAVTPSERTSALPPAAAAILARAKAKAAAGRDTP